MDQATLRPPGLMDLLSFYGSSKGVKPNTSSLYFTLSDSSYNSVILIARTGHPASHALQKMQSGSFTGSDFFFEVGCPGESTQSKTLTGQTEMQIPSPSQESWSTATEVPCTPSFPGGFTSPLTLCELWSPTTCFFMKS